MNKFQETRTINKLSADDCYARALVILPKQGFEVVKTRDFAWLIQTRKRLDTQQFEMNFTARPTGSNATVTLNLSSDQVPEDSLRSEGEAVFTALQAG